MNMSKSFWGLVIKPEKRYEQEVEQSFHISKACLEPPSSSSKGDASSACTSVYIDVENEDFLLSNLKHGAPNESLDLNFVAGEKICFRTEGTGTVHLTGYLIPDDQYMDEFDESDLEEEEEEEEEEVPILVNGQKRKGGLVPASSPQKKKVKEETPLDKALAEKKKKGLDLKPPQNDREYKAAIKQAEEMRKKIAMSAEKSKGNEDDEDDEDDEYEDIDDDEDDGEEDDDEMGEGDSDDDDEEEEEFESKINAKKTPDKKKQEGSPAANGKSPKTPSNGAAMTPGKKDKNKGQEKPANGTPAKIKKENQTPTKGQDSTQKKPQKTPKRMLKGGIQVEDLKEGAGPEAKRGKTVGMFYDGRLATNNKRFDSKLEGNPFKFKLGFGEVIKGWDVGVEGMKVGSKRRLTIPAKMAYGDKAMGDIPANSTLVFEVECKFVS